MKNSNGEDVALYRVTMASAIYVLARSKEEAEVDATDAFHDGCELGLSASEVKPDDSYDAQWHGALPYGHNGANNRWTIDEILELMKSGKWTSLVS